MSIVTRAMHPITGVILVLLLSACSNPPIRDNNVRGELHDALEVKPDRDTIQTTPPPEVSAALLPPVQLQLPGIDAEADLEQRFDVKVRRVPARDFFLSLVQNTPYNIIVHHDVSGYLSLDLKNVSVREVMDVVRNVNGYEYKIKGNNIQVFPNTIHTRIFQIDYLAMTRSGQSIITSKTGQISLSGSGTGDTQENGTSSGSNSSSISTVTDADFWRELKASLEVLVGTEEGRRVVVNQQTGVIMVRAMPTELSVVEEYLDNNQAIAQRQVILEARILEVILDDGFQSGINWAALQESGDTTIVGGQTGGGSIFDGTGYSNLRNSSGMLDIATSTDALNSATSAFGGVFSLAIATSDFTAFIELLKTQGDVQVLSSPRVSSVNNQKAVIKVGSDEFYVTSIDTDTTSVSDTTSTSVELDPFFSGVALDVTPQISARGDIVLHIHPAVSEVSEQTKTVVTTQGTLTMPLAASTIRESDTIIRAANGQVVVIGGLMQNASQDEIASVPLLGDIPLIGGLFRHTKKSSRKSELVILLKPTVIDVNGKVWEQERARSSRALRGMMRDM
ncbi:MAG: pilus (MSHA type) biogenesis protein MshL [Gammaproteobacteria bacterium]|nr:pilus (MSHA type) biogenesis protein MshL [Gammaproteobacteria bacterium]MCW8841383.1 pilus (MSHA type) biogenesis protein MshL [Gammaproteobacteria bacterium]MCW8958589.1 pilus (MSHA type) biogenesis protein MshL [Gammaproteobacteria bacterium]MCW8974024.1 pilus (MSHA type) biogenesis protein MshL [Gammaproteobacteria bacterium]MCW8993121.1 pilus (MSHA type) biogenesis protein MshL [Gammaproteobacteria bacterium]